MRAPSTRSRIASTLLVAAAALAPVAQAQTAAPPATTLGWKHAAELGYVSTSGNAESSTIGAKYTGLRDWAHALLTLKAGGTRVETTQITRYATADDPTQADELKTSSVSAENYYFNGRYDRNITERFFWYASAGWDRNVPSGVQDRYIGSAGVGNIWKDRDDLKFRTYYGVTYTSQDDVVPNPLINDSYAGARGGWDYLNKFGENTTFTSILVLDANFDESDDWRIDTTEAVAVAMSEKLALKASLQLLYDHLPALQDVPLFLAGEAPGAGTPIGRRFVQAEDLDTIFSVSLVVTF